MSHFIAEPRNFTEVTILPADVKNNWLKENLKEVNILINNQTVIMNDPGKGDPVTPCMDF